MIKAIITICKALLCIIALSALLTAMLFSGDTITIHQAVISLMVCWTSFVIIVAILFRLKEKGSLGTGIPR